MFEKRSKVYPFAPINTIDQYGVGLTHEQECLRQEIVRRKEAEGLRAEAALLRHNSSGIAHDQFEALLAAVNSLRDTVQAYQTRQDEMTEGVLRNVSRRLSFASFRPLTLTGNAARSISYIV